MKKKIIACIYIVMLLIASKLAFTYIYNEFVISKYNDGEYDVTMKPSFMCNWIQPYIAHYNAGNIHYQNGDYEEAINEYKLAMKREPKSNHKCDIRINMALSMIKQLSEDYSSKENLENTIEVLTKARELLIEDACAKDSEAGHSKEATKLREEIDNILKELNKKQEGGGNSGKDDDDPKDNPNKEEPKNDREQQVIDKIKQQQNNAYKDRYNDKRFYEELYEEYGNYFDGPIW